MRMVFFLGQIRSLFHSMMLELPQTMMVNVLYSLMVISKQHHMIPLATYSGMSMTLTFIIMRRYLVKTLFLMGLMAIISHGSVTVISMPTTSSSQTSSTRPMHRHRSLRTASIFMTSRRMVLQFGHFQQMHHGWTLTNQPEFSQEHPIIPMSELFG